MAEMHLPHASHDAAPPGVHHETSDVDIRAIFGFGLGLTIVTAVVAAAVWLLFLYFSARESRPVFTEYPLAAQDTRLPPEPRLQTNPRQEMHELRAREDELLISYGWVDKDKGVVRIPIERAMQLIVERGLPTQSANARQ